MPSRFSAKNLLVLPLLGLLLLATSVQAQITSPLDLLSRATPQPNLSDLSRSTIPLEGALDPETYVVGPNDAFSVTVDVGGQPLVVPAVVSADGLLVLPQAGSIEAAGLTLAVVRQRALDRLRPLFPNQRVSVALVHPRQFWVHVAGAVPLPGRHLATPVARVDDVLRQAFTTPDSTGLQHRDRTRQLALRSVLLTRQDGTTRSLDLLRYYATGDTEHNPYLQDGDVVTVRTYRPAEEAVFVDGDVTFPGPYDFRPGDTLLDLLRLAVDPAGLDALGTVRLSRTQPDGTTQTTTHRVPDLRSGRAAPVALQPLDQIHVPLPDVQRGTVTVEGAVPYPGTYPVISGETTLRALLDRAGGFRDDALVRGAYLERAVPEASQDPAQALRSRQPFSPEAEEARVARQYYTETRLAGLDFFSRTFLLRELDRQNRVAIPLADALSGAADVPLYDGDRLVVPRNRNAVVVIGQVNQPGYVPARSGWTATDYVTAAGGTGPEARQVYVIEAGTGRFLPADQAGPLQSGDLVFVDRRPMADTTTLQQLALLEQQVRMQRQNLWIPLITAGIGSITAIITALIFTN